METKDGRGLSHGTLEEIRVRAVRQVVEGGASPETVIRTLGLHRSGIYKWISQYHAGGYEALRSKPLHGRPRKLDARHEQWIYSAVTGKNPLQLKFQYALWTAGMVRDFIRSRYGVAMSVTSVNRLLKKIGLSCQRPIMRALQQDGEAVREWIVTVYPKIKRLARETKADIYFGDEASVRSDYHAGTTWGVKGKTPVVRTTGARFSLNMISAVNPRGKMRFMTHKGKMNSAVFCLFLKRMLHNGKRPVFLVLDGHPVHRSLVVRRFVEATKGRLRLFHLPPYSPELNPDELVWNNVKGRLGRSSIKGPDDLRKKAHGHLKSLQRNPKKVRSFFDEPNVRYAA